MRVGRTPDGSQTIDILGDVLRWQHGRFDRTGLLTRPRVSHAAVALPDGRVLVMGGEGPGRRLPRATASCEICDPHGARCASTHAMREPRAGHPALLLPDGRVFVGGGHGARWGGYASTTEVFSPRTGFRPGPPLAAPRAEHTATLLRDGRILVVAGQRYHRAEDRLDFLATVELLTP
jgi:hypothetical protein